MNRYARIALAAFTISIAGCSSFGKLAGSIPSANPSFARDGQTIRARDEPLMYVYDGRFPGGAIEELSLDGRLERTIRDGLSEPGIVAIDGSGTLYVENRVGASFDVTEYAAGSTRVLHTIRHGIGATFDGMAVDPKGNLYVLSDDSLRKYGPGAVDPAFATHRGFCSSMSTASFTVDSRGTSYVGMACGTSSDRRGFIREYDGTPDVARTIALPSTQWLSGMAIDASGTLYTQFFDTTTGLLSIGEYERAATAPFLTFAFQPRRFAWVNSGAPAIDESTGRVYAEYGGCSSLNGGPWKCNSAISAFNRGSTVPTQTIQPPRRSTFAGETFDPHGDLYTQTESPPHARVSILRYPGGKAIVSGRHLFLMFVWQTAGTPDARAASNSSSEIVCGLLSGCHKARNSSTNR
jgi:hypothetical protein